MSATELYAVKKLDAVKNPESTPLVIKSVAVKVQEPLGTRRCLFIKERTRASIFRILAFVAIGFDIYSVTKKYIRGHYAWVGVSVFFLIVASSVGSLYSLYCEVLEKNSYNSPEKKKDKSFHQSENIKLKSSHSVQGFDDVVETLNYDSDSESDQSDLRDAARSTQKPKKKKKKVGVMFADTEAVISHTKTKTVKKGTYVEPAIVDPKMDGDEDYFNSSPIVTNQPSLSLKEFILGIGQYCSLRMKLSHILLFPKEYQFCKTSAILWNHLKEPSHKESSAKINKQYVKDVSFRPRWNEFCYREIISKQLSLLMAVVQTVPMTFIELLYWSVKSDQIAKLSKPSFFNVTTFGGEQFNIFELASLIINIINISYRLVSLMNQIRRMNFSKQDMNCFHLVYLTMIYFFLLSSRVISLYLVMCLNTNGLLFTVSLLIVQFFTMYLVTRNLCLEGNSITMFISNVLMLFLYVPPKSGRRISMLNYHLIIFIEMIVMLFFGCHQLASDNDLSTSISIVGHDVSSSQFYWFYAVSLAVFVLSWFMNSEFISKCLFKYREKISRDRIRDVLRETNKEFGTDYQIIIGYYGQDKTSFSAQQTIHLF